MVNVLVVLNNFSRPQNMPGVIRAWKGQTIPVHVVVTDNRPRQDSSKVNGSDRELYPDWTLDGADDVWRMSENLGCPCHFYPALALYRLKYTIFADDDMLPGTKAVENLLGWATTLNDEFSSIGQVGRNIYYPGEVGKRYNARNVPDRSSVSLIRTDLTCRVKMVRTEFIPYVFTLRSNILADRQSPDIDGGKLAARLCGVHDDMLLDLGIQTGIRYPSYVIPKNYPENELIFRDLDDGKALWRRAGHFEDRNRMIDLCVSAGWRPVV